MNHSSQNPVSENRSDDLDWLAFQYLAGELSPADGAAFEDRLACDRHACEAVARMMQTVDALAVAVPAVAPRSLSPSRPATSPSRHRWVALVSAACLVAVSVFLTRSSSDAERMNRTGMNRTGMNRTGMNRTGANQAGEIVSLWAEAAVDSEVPEQDRSLDSEESDLTEEDSVPGWMMSAVEHEAREGEPEMEEN